MDIYVASPLAALCYVAFHVGLGIELLPNSKGGPSVAVLRGLMEEMLRGPQQYSEQSVAAFQRLRRRGQFKLTFDAVQTTVYDDGLYGLAQDSLLQFLDIPRLPTPVSSSSSSSSPSPQPPPTPDLSAPPASPPSPPIPDQTSTTRPKRQTRPTKNKDFIYY
uniref:Uncharacterized protein n=1 Tax=Photinus pyralis TaxID=7054 RepID=A0A1Y1KMR2_PHOPY